MRLAEEKLLQAVGATVMKFKHKRFKDSIYSALCGLADAWRSERNMRFHTAAAAAAVAAGVYFRLTGSEWLFLFSAIFLVMTMEMLNTALERVVDLFTREYHPLARLAKMQPPALRCWQLFMPSSSVFYLWPSGTGEL